jgi:hypothetical protein
MTTTAQRAHVSAVLVSIAHLDEAAQSIARHLLLSYG